MKKTLWMVMALALSTAPAGGALAKGDLATDNNPESQAQVKKRLEEIWAVCAQKDFAKLASFHMYGPKFTEFKDGEPRGDATSNRKEEEGQLAMMADSKVDMKDLAVNVYGDTAIATFNGDFSAKIQGKPLAAKMGVTMVFVKSKGDWKIVHEHFSPIGPPQGMPPGPPSR